MPLLTDFKATATLAWDHALSLLSLYVSHGKRALFFSLSSQEAKKKKDAWSQVTATYIFKLQSKSFI